MYIPHIEGRPLRIAPPLPLCHEGGVGDADQIRALIEARADAMRRKDAAAAIALLDERLVAFEMIPPLALPPDEARDASMLERWFESWVGPITVEIRDLVIHAGGDIAYSHSLNRLAGTRVGGAQTDIWMRSTLGFRRTGDGWRIAHGHSSVPIDPANGFAACLGLKP
jgi:ketosteroid isomerase-like protein